MQNENKLSMRSRKENSSLTGWLVRRVFSTAGNLMNKEVPGKSLLKLGEHLLDDLGFDQDGRPLQWSSFKKVDSCNEPKKVIFEECIYSKKPVCCR